MCYWQQSLESDSKSRPRNEKMHISWDVKRDSLQQLRDSFLNRSWDILKSLHSALAIGVGSYTWLQYFNSALHTHHKKLDIATLPYISETHLQSISLTPSPHETSHSTMPKTSRSTTVVGVEAFFTNWTKIEISSTELISKAQSLRSPTHNQNPRGFTRGHNRTPKTLYSGEKRKEWIRNLLKAAEERERRKQSRSKSGS